MVAPPPSIPSREEKKGVWIEVKKIQTEEKKRAPHSQRACEETNKFSLENPKAIFTWRSKGSGPAERETIGQLQIGTF
jgi:hypothetical protein